MTLRTLSAVVSWSAFSWGQSPSHAVTPPPPAQPSPARVTPTVTPSEGGLSTETGSCK